MPVHAGHDRSGGFYQWGRHGKRYHFHAHDPKGQQAAAAAAGRQGRAAFASGYQEGAGFWDVVSDAKHLAHAGLNALRGKLPQFREGAPPNVRKWLATHGNDPIERIEIRRAPIAGAIDKVLNLISLGGWAGAKKQLGYSQMMHLYLVLHFKSGEKARLERNHVIEMFKWHGEGAETKAVPMPKPIPFATFWQNAVAEASKHGSPFVYNPGHTNCQAWVRDCLKGNHLLTPDALAFIMQDAEALLAKLNPVVRGVMQGTTNVAHKLDVALHGVGLSVRDPHRAYLGRLDYQIAKDKWLREEARKHRTTLARSRRKQGLHLGVPARAQKLAWASV